MPATTSTIILTSYEVVALFDALALPADVREWVMWDDATLARTMRAAVAAAGVRALVGKRGRFLPSAVAAVRVAVRDITTAEVAAEAPGVRFGW